jgi:hypothetical protein
VSRHTLCAQLECRWDNIADMICKQIDNGSTVHLVHQQNVLSNEQFAVKAKLHCLLSARKLSVELNLCAC